MSKGKKEKKVIGHEKIGVAPGAIQPKPNKAENKHSFPLQGLTIADIVRKFNRKQASASQDQKDNTCENPCPDRGTLFVEHHIKEEVLKAVTDLQLNIFWNC